MDPNMTETIKTIRKMEWGSTFLLRERCFKDSGKTVFATVKEF
jgi:hypothetical protein